ncbi:LPD29 domain-containing protein [Streptomyces sp. NPDC053474]|uniref:LPD29 domain-containing protein n=1 Tax=Streptomyces sp. NPDC053474 TaxID=3365704 RepID=UPI0037D8DD83
MSGTTDIANTAYLALRLPAGTRVTYHGTQAALHGVWTVQPCACRRCAAATLLGQAARRYELYTVDGKPGPLVHVRHTSVTPVVGTAELGEAVCGALPTKYASAYLRKELRKAFPGVKFSVVTGRGKDRWTISVSWAGGPGRTQVGAIAAPLLAKFGPGDRRRPRHISVTVGGRVRTGMPRVSDVVLCRTN